MPDVTSTTSQDSWTTRNLLAWMSAHFESKGVDAPRVVAEMLLAHVLDCDRLHLYMEADRPASPDERSRLRDLAKRAAEHEPVHLLVGRASFFGREYRVAPCTLIPQPCTEALVEALLDHVGSDRESFSGMIADIGTGTGCIAIALALQLPRARFIATDLSAEVLDLARQNTADAGVENQFEFRTGPTWEPLEGERFDAIVSNPPYIPDTQWPREVQPAVRNHIAESALRGGPDGLDVIRPLIMHAHEHLNPGGLLALELAEVLREPILSLVGSNPALTLVDLMKDEDDQWRTLLARAEA